jgi:hypothetical protein
LSPNRFYFCTAQGVLGLRDIVPSLDCFVPDLLSNFTWQGSYYLLYPAEDVLNKQQCGEDSKERQVMSLMLQEL